jgi:hypothetical protein
MNSHTTPPPVAAAPCVPVEQPALFAVLRLDSPGAILAREPVRPDDLNAHVAEAWREGCLRKGRIDVPLIEASVWLRPIFKPGQRLACAGFALETHLPGAEPLATAFTNRSLDAVASRAAERLLKSGKLKEGQHYVYEIHFQPDARPGPPSDAGEIDFELTDHSPRLTCIEAPLRSLLEQATPRNEIDEGAFHVFFTLNAFARAEQFARKGASASPPVETGAALAGVLCSCPDSGDFFVVITDAYEVMAAEEKPCSIELSHESWRRILSTIKARAARSPALRLIGQAHGHNFLPAGGQTCEACPTRAVCDLTNVFASDDDQNWTRAHFAGQPWSVCTIFGLSARADRLHEVFTQHNARLRRRGYFVLPDFDLELWPSRGPLSQPRAAMRPPSPQPSRKIVHMHDFSGEEATQFNQS